VTASSIRRRSAAWTILLDYSEEKHEPVSDIDTVGVNGLKALDPKRPIREADMVAGTSAEIDPNHFAPCGCAQCV
jgi:hypothetical protein